MTSVLNAYTYEFDNKDPGGMTYSCNKREKICARIEQQIKETKKKWGKDFIRHSLMSWQNNQEYFCMLNHPSFLISPKGHGS